MLTLGKKIFLKINTCTKMKCLVVSLYLVKLCHPGNRLASIAWDFYYQDYFLLFWTCQHLVEPFHSKTMIKLQQLNTLIIWKRCWKKPSLRYLQLQEALVPRVTQELFLSRRAVRSGNECISVKGYFCVKSIDWFIIMAHGTHYKGEEWF